VLGDFNEAMWGYEYFSASYLRDKWKFLGTLSVIVMI
jgi:hypothetical protein